MSTVQQKSLAIGARANVGKVAFIVDAESYLDGPATDGAIFRVTLRTGGQIDDRFKTFAAIRAMNDDRLDHDLLDHP